MSDAARTRLPKYSGPKDVYAARITGIESFPGPAPYSCLTLGEIEKVVNPIQAWVGAQRPEVGGWYAVFDTPDVPVAEYISATEFERDYKKVVGE